MPYQYIKAKYVKRACKALGKRCTTEFLDEMEDKIESLIKMCSKMDSTDNSLRRRHLINTFNLLKGLDKL